MTRKIAFAGSIIGVLAVLGLVAYTQHPAPADRTGGSIATPVATFETSLAARISDTATSMTLVSTTTEDGTKLVPGSIYGFTLDDGTSNLEYVIGYMSTTSGSSDIVYMTRGISVVTGTTSIAALEHNHGRGASVKISNAPVLLQLAAILDGRDTVPNLLSYQSGTACTSSSPGSAICDKAFLVAVSGQGAATSTATQGGIVLLASALQTASSTYLGVDSPLVLDTTNATDTPQSGCAAGFTGIAGAACTVIADLTGHIKQAWLDIFSTANTWAAAQTFSGTATFNGAAVFNGAVSGSFLGNFGDGSDGDLTIASNSTTTITRDMYYNNLVVSGTLVTSNYRVFVKGTLSGTGKIETPNGNAGTNGSNGAAGSGGGGGAGGAWSCGYFCSIGGTAGGAGANATAANGTVGVNASVASSTIGRPGSRGATGSNGNTTGQGAAAGTVDAATSTLQRPFILASQTYLGADMSTSTGFVVWRPNGQSSGGGGGGSGDGGGGAGGGGGGGASGGVVFIAANAVTFTGTIRAIGGAGGAGGSGQFGTDGAGGGGGGGDGGDSILIYGTKTGSITYLLTLGAAGGSATAGKAGTSWEIAQSSLLH